MRFLEASEWIELARDRDLRVEPWLDAYRKRRARRVSHPIHDFLFTYYKMNRKVLSRWRPMSDMRLGGDEAQRFLEDDRYREFDGGVGLSAERISTSERARIDWIMNLLEQALTRPPQFGCHGLHEWAMLYKADVRRHEGTPLRVSEVTINAVVESQRIYCTHHDAFRFFSKLAQPMNGARPGREDRPEYEQFGCVHFNMDLFRWCYKLSPWIGSELMDECFFLAIDARVLDMRASPYDVRPFGYEPIEIETAEGRDRYASKQKEIYRRGQPLARQLLAECRRLIAMAQSPICQ